MAKKRKAGDGLIRVNPAIGCKLPPKKAREMQVRPPAVVQVLKKYHEGVLSRWMFPSPVLEDMPLNSCSAYD